MSVHGHIEDLRSRLLQLIDSYPNSFEVPLMTHRKGVFGKIDVLAKCVIRKCTRFLLKPYAENSSIFRNDLLYTLRAMIDSIEAIEEQFKSIQEQMKLQAANSEELNYKMKIAYSPEQTDSSRAMKPISIEDARKIRIAQTIAAEEGGRCLEINNIIVFPILLMNNTGIELSSDGEYPLHMSYHWLDKQGNMVVYDGIRSKLPVPVLPSTNAVIDTKVQTPSKCGEYVLRITLVQESVRWFDEPDVDLRMDFQVRVIEETPWWSSDEEDDIVYGNISVINKAKYRKYFQYKNMCRPLALFVETCNICNLKCIICPSSMMSGKREIMDEYLFEKTISDYCDIGGGHLSLSPTRGDVFLDKHLLKRFQYVNKQELIKTVSITTNAVGASRFCEQDLSYIINSIDFMQISIYGLDEDEYFTMTRRKGCYEKMVANVKNIVRLNEKSSIYLSFRFLKNHTQSVVEQWILAHFGYLVPYGYIREYMNWGGDMDTTKTLPHGAKWLTARETKDIYCYLPIVSTKVFVNGDVKFCNCVDYNNVSENTLGNIKSSKLIDLYNGEKAKKLFRKGISKCHKCSVKPDRSLASIENLYLSGILDEPTKYMGG